jgi:translation initiation factor eIF-2B subunit delta
MIPTKSNHPTTTSTTTTTTTAAVTAKVDLPPMSSTSGKKKPINPDIVIPPKKPPLSKAERRALQEKQRAEKAEAAGKKQTQPPKQQLQEGKTALKDGITGPTPPKVTEGNATAAAATATVSNPLLDPSNVVQLFAHLPPYNNIVRNCSVSLEGQSGIMVGASTGTSTNAASTSALSSSTSASSYTTSSTSTTVSNSTANALLLHPAILQLSVQYRDGIVRGANQRCKAMLHAFQTVIQHYTSSSSSSSSASCTNSINKKTFSQELDLLLKNAFTYLTKHSRPHSTSMGNAFTFLKIAIANLERDMPEEQAKVTLCEQIDAYIRERITYADEAISTYAVTKIQNGDVILIYAKSEVILVLLKKAFHHLNKKFRVIVVDSRPLHEGREMLQALHREGIPCTYILLNAVSYVMSKEVTKVFLGAAALMSDGSVQNRVGTLGLALMAHSCNVPVLVCCETYKISNRVQLESFTGNELSNPDVGVAFTDANTTANSSSSLRQWRTTPNLKLLNIMYDLTPSEFVSGIVTEMGILPPTSVAVILREMNPQDGNY